MQIPPNPDAKQILHEVVRQDCYGLQALHHSGYRVENCVDLGAYFGAFGWFLRQFWPQARIIAVEPNADMLPFLQANLGRDLCCPVAVRYDHNDDYYVSSHASGSVIYDPAINFSESIPQEYEHRKVTVKPFEVVDDWLHGATIDLLKIDIEGSEFSVLAGMPEPTRKRIRRIVGEYHHLAGWPYLKTILEHRFPHLTPRCLGDPANTIGPFEAV